MSAVIRGRRWAVRLALLVGAIAALPVFAGSAQASVGGAPPPTTNFRPDLISVHLLTGLNAGRAQFCFDKPIAVGGSGASYRLIGYRWDTVLLGAGAPVLDSTGKCALVLMGPDHSGGQADLASYSDGSVLGGAVSAAISGGQANLPDSSPLLDSTSHNGTAGHTTGPDLVGVTVGAPAGTNEIIYTFDQPLDTGSPIRANNFEFYDAAGNIHDGVTITGIDSVGDVRVNFGKTVVTSNAVIANIDSCIGNVNGCTGVVGQSDTPDPETYAPEASVTVPGTGGVTALPDLVSTTLVPGSSNQIDYTFDKNVASATADDFQAYTSNGDDILGKSAVVLPDGTTVRVTFSSPNVSSYLEEIVWGEEDGGAVTDTNGNGNTFGGKPAGDNAGAFATGFTNGPDATSVTFDKTSGQVTVFFDQRVAANAAGQPVDNTGAVIPLGRWTLLDANGNALGNPSTATVQSTGPYQSSVLLTFSNPALVSVAQSLEISGNQASSGANPYVQYGGSPLAAVFTSGDPGITGFQAAGNVQQILAPTVTGAVLQGKGTRIHLRRVHITNKKHRRHHTHH